MPVRRGDGYLGEVGNKPTYNGRKWFNLNVASMWEYFVFVKPHANNVLRLFHLELILGKILFGLGVLVLYRGFSVNTIFPNISPWYSRDPSGKSQEFRENFTGPKYNT